MAAPNSTSRDHYGARIEFDADGYLYFTIGDNYDHFEKPQDVTKDGGKVYRLHDDGRIPRDNPFVGQPGAREAGKLRLEGKEYVVREGDVMLFRFNV